MLKYFAHVPHEGEHLVEQNCVFEVLAREGHRVDKVLVLTTKTAGTNPKSADAVDSSDALIVHPPSTRCRNPRPRPNLATPRQQRDRAERPHRRRRHPPKAGTLARPFRARDDRGTVFLGRCPRLVWGAPLALPCRTNSRIFATASGASANWSNFSKNVSSFMRWFPQPQRGDPYQPRATPWVSRQPTNQALKGRSNTPNANPSAPTHFANV